MADQPVYVRIPEDLLDVLDHLIQDIPGNRSDHIRQAVREYVDRLRTAPWPQPPAANQNPAAAEQTPLREAGQ